MLNFFLKNLWLWKCGLNENELNYNNMPKLEQLKTTEWNNEIETLVRNRLIMGSFRYGMLKQKTKYNRVDSIIERMEYYKKDNNKEHLIDCIALCVVEYVKGESTIFKATDDNIHCI